MDEPTSITGNSPVRALRQLSVRSLMFWLVLVVLLPAMAVSVWFLATELKQARAAAEAEVKLLANNAAATLQLTLSDQRALMQRLAERPQVRALDPDKFDSGVIEYLRLHPEYNNLGVRDRDARLVFSGRPGPPNPPEQFREFPWFKQGLASGGFMASDAFKGTLSGRWVTVLTQPVRDERGGVAGLLNLSQDLLALNRRILGSVPADAVVAVTDRQSRYLLRSAEPEVWVGQPVPAKFLHDTQGQTDAFLSATGPDGVARLYAFVTMTDTGWRVIAGVPQDRALAGYRALLWRSLLVGFGLLLLAALAAWRVGRRIIGPIDALADTAARMADGDKLVRAAAAGPAEIRAVAQEFNRMVDARTRSEQALRTSENSLAITLQSIGDAVIATDLEGRITRMNGTAERLTGWPWPDARGRPLAEVFRIVNAETGLAAVDPVQRVLATGAVVGLAHHIALLARDGVQYQIADSAAPIRDHEGRTVGVVLVFSDVTERQHAEAVRRSLETQLRESQKMESIGTLAGGIAHDFNNILGAILGNVALAREDVGTGHPALHSLDQIQRASVRARALVQQILTFSRRQPQALVVQPLNPIVEESLALLRSTLPAMVEVQVDLPAAPIHANTDATQMQQVLMNLCTNAWHALPSGHGRIEVGLDEQTLDAAAAHAQGGLPAGRYAHLWVRDSGVGMDAATRERMFEPFFTTKAAGDGTGLGLAVVHGIVTAQHGGISVSSGVGKGTTIDLYFPLREPPSPDPADSRVTTEPATGRGEHVLYVDDDEVMRLVVERLLQRAGLRVTSLSNVSQALTALAAASARFDIVVTDFSMPEASGLELAREVARLYPGLPVVIASGYVSDELRRSAGEVGVNHVPQKQNLLEELVPLVQRILSDHRVARPS